MEALAGQEMKSQGDSFRRIDDWGDLNQLKSRLAYIRRIYHIPLAARVREVDYSCLSWVNGVAAGCSRIASGNPRRFIQHQPDRRTPARLPAAWLPLVLLWLYLASRAMR